MFNFLFYLFILSFVICDDDSGWSIVGNPLLALYPCNGSEDISISFEPGRAPGEENEYSLFFNKQFPISSKVLLKFDAEAVVNLNDKTFARISVDNDIFRINFFKAHKDMGLYIKGVNPGIIPYLTSVKINNKEYCSHPNVGALDSFVMGYKTEAVSVTKKHDESCGRRKVTHTELIVNGAPTKPGDWPWHVALYRFEKNVIKYNCGGTLISTDFVLTAAHCVTIRGNPITPDILSVVLGKYNLIGGDTDSQEREIAEIIIHDMFNHRNLDHDIALLKLKSKASFNDYIQPACIWYPQVPEKLATADVYGTVVGWGFDQTDKVSSKLLQATLPIVSEATCIKSNPVFYGKILNENKFCAGYRNGTSPCNGDSGGGFAVFVPDIPKNASEKATGAWYIRGIVSVTVSRTDVPICDSEQNVVFTDVAKYRLWIQNYVKDIK